MTIIICVALKFLKSVQSYKFVNSYSYSIYIVSGANAPYFYYLFSEKIGITIVQTINSSFSF